MVLIIRNRTGRSKWGTSNFRQLEINPDSAERMQAIHYMKVH
jgi:hypothetical protein